MDVVLSALVVLGMVGGFLAFIAGLGLTFTKKHRRTGALVALVGLGTFVAATILGQFTA